MNNTTKTEKLKEKITKLALDLDLDLDNEYVQAEIANAIAAKDFGLTTKAIEKLFIDRIDLLGTKALY
jgi:hypothetical protein